MAAEPTSCDASAAAPEAPKIPARGPVTGPLAPSPQETVAPTANPPPAAAAARKPSKPSSHANRAKNVALSALTGGSIGLPPQEVPAPGFLPAGGGNRKVIPELVLPFPLPCEDVAPEAGTELAQSVVFLQALRQTRMMHMLQILPPYSHRQRAGMEFYEAVPPSLLPGLQARSAHTLVSLGRADVHVGPMTYYGVRFWHVRPAPVPVPPPRPVRPPPPSQAPTPGTVPPSATSAPPPPPLDAGFVARLQQRAESDPHLQRLLQLARMGQLPDHGMVQLNAILASLMTPPVLPPEDRAPPVILVEFPENPSLHFVLPLWHAAVERRHAAGYASSVLLSFWAPAIGSKAAGESGHDEAQAAVHGMLVRDASHVKPAPPPPTPPPPPAASSTPPEPKRRRTGTRSKPIKDEESVHAAAPPASTEPSLPPRNHELFPLTWRITSDHGVDERLWDCLGRVPGCLTNGAWASTGDERVFAAIKASFAERKRTMPVLHRLPCHIRATDIPPGLMDHVQDRYAMRISVHTHRPLPKRKVAMVSDTKEGSLTRTTEPMPRAPVLSEDGVKPKRKRHVATHNPDGSLKSCGACGKTKTPMWRRGPKGPSQLCNACGAKWKAGRLIVPDVPPPPILNDLQPVRYAKPPAVSAPPPLPAPPALTSGSPHGTILPGPPRQDSEGQGAASAGPQGPRTPPKLEAHRDSVAAPGTDAHNDRAAAEPAPPEAPAPAPAPTPP